MKIPFFFAFCVVGVVAGCVIGALWFTTLMSVQSNEWGIFILFPLNLFDSFLFAWFPALLFGAILHFVMFRLGWMKVWQWALVGGWVARSGALPLLLLGLGILRNLSNWTWPAAICGAITATILHPLARRLADPPTWVFERRI